MGKERSEDSTQKRRRSIFPDLIDLGPAIANKIFGINLPILEKLFPWHWPHYSGSIYTNNCGVSTLNHFLVVFTVVVICWFRRKDLKTIFKLA